jgi:hypothetical protein
MSNIGFNYKADGSIVIVAKTNGKTGLHTIPKTAMNYDEILKKLKAGDWDAIPALLNIRTYIADHTDGRVEIVGDEIYLDKKPIAKGISERIIAFFKDGINIQPFCRFLERVAANPAQSSRDELFLFLEKNSLPFTPEGYFLAYKMVRRDYLDIHSGTIRNQIGDKPEMAREEVDADRYNTCSVGLHFCSMDYLKSGFGSGGHRLMVVKIDPADVVSIPVDYNFSKGRCWKYEVVDEIEKDERITDYYTSEYDEEEEEDDEDDNFLYDDEEESSEEEEESESYYDEEDDEEEEEVELPASQMTGAKIEAEDVREIRKMLNDNWTLKAIAESFDISARQVARIRDGESWSHIK